MPSQCFQLLLLFTLPWVSMAFTRSRAPTTQTRPAYRSPERQQASSVLRAWPFPTIPAIRKSSSKYQSLERRVLEFFDCIQDESKLQEIHTLLLDEKSTDSTYWNDITAFYEPLKGSEAIERHLRLELLATRQRNIHINDIVIDPNKKKAAVLIQEKQLRSLVVLSFEGDLISGVDWSTESRTKTGTGSLKVLAAATKFLPGNEPKDAIKRSSKIPVGGMTPPEQYYDAWNARDIDTAVSVFTPDVLYDDTAFAKPLNGAEALRKHLNLCSDAFPDTIQFQPDCVIVDDSGDKLAVVWQVTNNNQKLPFTQGLSYYELEQGKIKAGIDFVDGTPIKTAAVERFAVTVTRQVIQEPVRLIPWAAWFVYMYVVFFSDGILPGANALQLEERTWKEVLDLSLNFFLVSPTLGLSFSPEVHPMLEAVFNLLLSWAALFVGFASDDRRAKPSVMPFGPTVLGMQFLTSAFYLPYLATRIFERTPLREGEELDGLLITVAENRLLSPTLLFVGSYSILWGIFGRADSFGSQFQERWSSFIDLLSIDRVGSSFLVDLVIFGLFQSWWIDDDLQRRGVAMEEEKLLRFVGKFFPFFGLGLYLILRPGLRTLAED